MEKQQGTNPTPGSLSKQSFLATVSGTGSKARLPIPFSPQEVWGERPRYHVRGSINGVMWRGPLSVDGEGYFISIGPAWLRDAGIKSGDQVSVELTLEGPQQENMAADITAALAADEAARTFFDGLATFYRKGYVNWIESAKHPETRARRIAEMMSLLQRRKKQR